MADRVGRHERAIEVHAFDDSIDGQHLDAVPFRLDDRRIVADADQEPIGCGGELPLDARDDLALGELRDERHFA